MGDDEAALLRLWREKRGEVEPEDLSGNLIVQLGLATEALNRRWYEANTGQIITEVQQSGAASGRALDGRDPRRHGRSHRGGVRERNSCCRGRSPKRRAAEKYMPQLQHNMWVTNAKQRCSRSSPAAASGSRSASRPIRSTSTSSSLRQRRNSGDALKVASRPGCLALNRHGRGSRRCASST